MMLYILGSGFSVPAGGPLLRQGLKDLFINEADSQAQLVYNWVCEHLYKHRPHWCDSVTLEEVVSRLDLFIHYKLLSETGRQASAQVREWLLNKFLETLQPRHLHSNPVYQTFAQQLNATDTLITFNYDLVLEDTLEHSGIAFHYPIHKSEESLPILKLHGSINYWQCELCGDMLVARDKPTCPRHRQGKLTQLIVPPTLYKNYRSFALRALWVKALELALDAKQVCIIGYSCSPADCLSLQLLDYMLGLGQCRQIIIVNGANYEPTVFSELGYAGLIHNTCLSFSDYVNSR